MVLDAVKRVIKQGKVSVCAACLHLRVVIPFDAFHTHICSSRYMLNIFMCISKPLVIPSFMIHHTKSVTTVTERLSLI